MRMTKRPQKWKVWVGPAIAATITLLILEIAERSGGFGFASIVGIAILLVVVVGFLRRRQL